MSRWDEILDAFGEPPQMSAALDALTGLLEQAVTVMIHQGWAPDRGSS